MNAPEPRLSSPSATAPVVDPHALLSARYGTAPEGVPSIALNPVLETLLSHRSVRAFLPDALPAGTLEWLIAAAQSASSSSNLQVFSVVAVEQSARKAALAELAGNQSFIRDAPVFLAWLIDLSRIEQIARDTAAPAEGLKYLDTFIMGAIDAALAAQNVFTAAESLGLGGVYVGALRNQPEPVSAVLGLPQHVFPIFGLALGRPDPARPADVKPRLAQSLMLHREQYSQAPIAERIADYDAHIEAFNRAQGQPPARWTERTLARLKDGAALRGRDRLKEALANQGFELR
ncbi:NADPH-dependent oxidoreductase [Uliginosibacterium sp. H1]|uniref:NADPH-dependent oxidoreductase n=1 Tax=Uliginosibacterium sp. H1 TaxID=3114757 RepID=UPI002E17A81E|nr:NADPH-dependent oxidoreductase [Uliginosibacterium sp. H1]